MANIVPSTIDRAAHRPLPLLTPLPSPPPSPTHALPQLPLASPALRQWSANNAPTGSLCSSALHRSKNYPGRRSPAHSGSCLPALRIAHASTSAHIQSPPDSTPLKAAGFHPEPTSEGPRFEAQVRLLRRPVKAQSDEASAGLCLTQTNRCRS